MEMMEIWQTCEKKSITDHDFPPTLFVGGKQKCYHWFLFPSYIPQQHQIVFIVEL